MNKKRIIIIVILGLLITCCVSYIVISLLPPKDPPPWYVLTSPLEQSVVDDLCGKLDLTTEERKELCEGQAIYADQFLNAIKRTFPIDSGYEIVQGKLAGYQSRLIQYEDGIHMDVFYDFRGDDVIEIAFYFKKNKLFLICSTQNYDDWFPGRFKQLTEEAQPK